MKALILNSGIGKRMGSLTNEHPKCMTIIDEKDTILSRQLRLLAQSEVRDVVITTGPFDTMLMDYCHSLKLDLTYTFVRNPIYDKTNYIYSIELAKSHLDDDLILMHGDLVFEDSVLQDLLKQSHSCMTVSSTLPLPIKDFKAVIQNKRIRKVGIEFFDEAIAAQPLYKLNRRDWRVWLNKISAYCEQNQTNCYAENALNEVSDQCHLYPMDFKDRLCAEIDKPEDLEEIKAQLLKGKGRI